MIDAAGPRNDLVDCVACRIEEQLRTAAGMVFAGKPARDGCQEALGRNGMDVLRLLLKQIHQCLQRGESESIAGCLADPARAAPEAELLAEWRSSAEVECGAVDPFDDLGYPRLCAGVSPVLPPSCADTAPPCTFSRATRLSTPSPAQSPTVNPAWITARPT